MSSFTEQLQEIVTRKNVFDVTVAIGILVTGSALARRLRTAVAKIERLDPQQRLLLSKVSYYGLLIAALAASLSQIGVDVKVIMGAAGVLTVAVGFAAQTSASNLISGLFLMIERPFVVGDVIAIGAPGSTTGEVLTIDLLSTKIRTVNNLMLRIPNETLVKSQITNYSYFPLRRIDFNLNVAYQSDLMKIETVLREVARVNPIALEDPSPVFVCNGFVDSGIALQFQVWTLAKNLVTLQNELYREIKTAFDGQGLALAFPTASPDVAAVSQLASQLATKLARN